MTRFSETIATTRKHVWIAIGTQWLKCILALGLRDRLRLANIVYTVQYKTEHILQARIGRNIYLNHEDAERDADS